VQKTKKRITKPKPKTAKPNNSKTKTKQQKLRMKKGSKPKIIVNDKTTLKRKLRT